MAKIKLLMQRTKGSPLSHFTATSLSIQLVDASISQHLVQLILVSLYLSDFVDCGGCHVSAFVQKRA